MRTNRVSVVLGIVLLVATAGKAMAQGRGYGRGRGAGGPGGGQNAAFQTDHQVFQFLLQNHDKVQRKVKMLDNGVETVTESEDPAVAAKIQEHVQGMYRRVKMVSPIRMRDPLFAELFRNAGKIELKHEKTAKGVRVVETSDDPYVAKLIQAHAEVVSLFVKNGHIEAARNHVVPGGQQAGTEAVNPASAACCPARAKCQKCPQAGGSCCPAAGDAPVAPLEK